MSINWTVSCSGCKSLRRLLARVEWTVTTQGQGSSMGATDGTDYPACPICGGIRPGSMAERDFAASAIGHRKTCALARALKEKA